MNLEERARMLCRSVCRAAMCERLGMCLDCWPGCGGYLNRFFPQIRLADKLLEEAE
jgi:hypothetical protein